MGYWSIDDDETENMWGDAEADTLGDYFDYLIITDRERLTNLPQLIEDARILCWNGFYESEVGRSLNDFELQYGIMFTCGQEDNYIEYYSKDHYGKLPEIHVSMVTSDISYKEIETHLGFEEESNSLFGYMWYLKDAYPSRLNNKAHMLEATRLLSYYDFFELKGRVAKDEEIRFILEAMLHKLPWMALVK